MTITSEQLANLRKAAEWEANDIYVSKNGTNMPYADYRFLGVVRPTLLALINSYEELQKENACLRNIKEAAKEFSAAKYAMDAHIPNDESWAELHRRQRDTQKRLDELLGEGETK